ncbi:MAG: HAD-IIIC family phosphatase [Magnetococcales bacterium]|nr:HAD-IIIC family phosphatase [Magnetococcales bacterium]
MNFLEASKLLRTFKAERSKNLLLVMSGTANQMVLFLRAYAARRHTQLSVQTIAFGTLQQFILSPSSDSGEELFLLMPWDLVPNGDWRTGLPTAKVDAKQMLVKAEQCIAHLRQRKNARFAYLPAPILPIFANDKEVGLLEAALLGLVRQLDAHILHPELFSFGSYLSTGSPVGGAHMGRLAEQLDQLLRARKAGYGKVLATDLDNVLWAGLAADEGANGVLAGPEGNGFPHYLYQSYLKCLKQNGILLVAVSRNDEMVARAPLQTGNLLLTEDDFITIAASYDAKSAHIRAIAAQLNLGLDAFVFVDDNPVELAEVSSALPQVTCLQFPEAADLLPDLFATMARCFRRETISQEDRERTILYRRRTASMPLPNKRGADLTAFLSTLRMTLEITDRSRGDRARAVQLINKTNQFNLNGRRFEDREIEEILVAGGRLLTASLSDSMGSHGEILAFLVSSTGDVVAWVISCRVFQRRVEHAFLAWLSNQPSPPHTFIFQATERNKPFMEFADDAAFSSTANGCLDFDWKMFATTHASSLNLFSISCGSIPPPV